VAPFILLSLKIEFNTYQRRLSEELDQRFGLMRPPRKFAILLVGYHYHSLLTLTGDTLRPLRPCSMENLTESRFCGLNLPFRATLALRASEYRRAPTLALFR